MAIFLDIISGMAKVASAIKGRIKESKDIDKNLSDIFGTISAFDEPLVELKNRINIK